MYTLHKNKPSGGGQSSAEKENGMKQSLMEKAHAHNTAVDNYIIELKKYFGGEKITAVQWFEAQTLIRKQNFYEKGMKILKELRTNGIDVKMDMQSHKLVLNGNFI